MGPRNRFQGMNSASLCSLAGRYDNPLPPRFLAPIDSLKIPALIKCSVVHPKWFIPIWNLPFHAILDPDSTKKLGHAMKLLINAENKKKGI
jgi:hypothetical protein